MGHTVGGELRSIPRRKVGMEMTDILYGVMKRRESTLDGLLYIGIVTTGIVCFPSCRSRLPKWDNVRVFETFEEARRAGFRACKRCKPDHPAGHSPDSDLVARVMEILETRYAMQITLDYLAEQMSVSPYHLQRVFKRRMGVSPTQVLLNIRIAKAREQLRETERGIAEICARVGFRSASHFAAVFKTRVGVSPLTYRRDLTAQVSLL